MHAFQQRPRILVVGLRHDLVEKRRREMKETGFSNRMHPRNGIEGTHSELVRGHGLRRTKYRGLSRVGLIALFHGRRLQCETISQSARLSDENAGSVPRLRAKEQFIFAS